MIMYLIQLSTIWTILLIAFYVFYKNKSYHQFNRYYILLSLLAGIVLPLIPSGVIHHDVPILTTGFQMITMSTVIISQVADAGNNFLYYFIIVIWIIYAGLVSVKLFQTINELSFYFKLTKQKNSKVGNAFVHYTDTFDQPFSFFKTIVLPKSLENETRTKEIIIAHELKHINCRHFNDLVILKILEILFPYHPSLYFFKKELVLIHEYQADQEAIKHSNVDDYSNILMQFAHKSILNGSIIHTFYFSPIKSRLMMLFKKSSKMQYLYLALVPFLFAACTLLNNDNDKTAENDFNKKEQFDYEIKVPLPPIVKGDTTITNSNATMGGIAFIPSFPGGEKELMEFLGKNIQYPANGKKNGIQGTSYIKFEVHEDGSIHNKEILRSLGNEFDQELIRVVDLMPNWLPPTKDGKKVKTTYTLPVKFKLAD